MSASKLPGAVFQPRAQDSTKRLSLSANDVRIRKNGIEFRSDSTIEPWTEMTVEIQAPQDPKKLNCTGVVVACTGARPNGYSVSMVFTGLSPATAARLETLAYSTLA